MCGSQALWAGSSQRAWAPSDGLGTCSPCRAPVSLLLAPTPTTVCPAGPQRGAFGNPSVTPCPLGLHPASAEPDAHQRLLRVGGAASAEPLCVGAGPATAARSRPGRTLTPAAASLPSSLLESGQPASELVYFSLTFLEVSKVFVAAPPTPQSKEPRFNLRLDVC